MDAAVPRQPKEHLNCKWWPRPGPVLALLRQHVASSHREPASQPANSSSLPVQCSSEMQQWCVIGPHLIVFALSVFQQRWTNNSQ